MVKLQDESELEELTTEEMATLGEAIQAISIGDGWSSHTMTYYGSGTRSILVSGEITSHTADSICSQIRQLTLEDDLKPIYVYINTPGGSVVDALAIYDTLRNTKCQIATIVCGACYSAGLIILSAGSIRMAMPHSMFFYHQPILECGEISSGESLQFVYEAWHWSQKKTNKILRDRTGIKKKLWKKEFKNRTAKSFSSKEALKWNFIDILLKPPVRNPQEDLCIEQYWEGVNQEGETDAS